MAIQNLFTSRDNNANAETYVGQVGRVWFNLDDNTFYVSDGSTPGGIAIGGGSGDYGNANVATFLADYGSNTVVTTGNITAGNIITSGLLSSNSVLISAGNGLVDIRATSNVVIKSDSANYEWLFDNTGVLTTPGDIDIGGRLTATGQLNLEAANNPNAYIQLNDTGNSLFGAAGNLSLLADGDSQEWVFGSDGTLTAPGSIIANNIGNIASIDLDGSTSNVLYGNGVFAPAGASSYGNANVATFLADFGSNTVVTTGNITGGSFIGNGASLTSITGANVTGVVGNATSAQNIRINTLGSGGLDYPVIFSLSAGAANAVSLYIDSDLNHFKYNPTTNVFTVGNAIITTNLTVSFGTVTASFGNINATSGSINAGARVVATGNVTGGNITTAGQVSATGNISGGNLALANTMTLGTATIVSGNAIPVTAGIVLLDADNLNSTWTLADGREGQVLYLIANNTSNTTTFNYSITVANLRHLDGSNAATITANATWSAWQFNPDLPSANAPVLVTTVYAGGAWNISTGVVT